MTARFAAWIRGAFELQAAGQARLLPMEGLRGLAVILVFLQHFGTQAEQMLATSTQAAGAVPIGAVMAALKQQGNVGVELFFVLSGFLIYGHLVQRRPRFGTFMARRAVRLYPAFLCVFALAAGLDLLRPVPLIPADPAGAAAMLAANLVFLPGLLRLQPLLAVAWSLSYEAFFYIAAAALVAGLSLERWSRGRRTLLILGLAAAFELATWWHGPNIRGSMRHLDLLDWDMPDRMLPFFFGMLLAEGVGLARTRLLPPVPGAVGLAAPALALVALSVWWLPDLPHEALVSVAFFLLCAASLRDPSLRDANPIRGASSSRRANLAARLFTWAPLRWLGNMSYSYYLVHGLVVLAATRAVTAAAMRTGFAALPPLLVVALLPAVFALTLLPAAALFLLVEKPLSLRPRVRRRDLEPAG